MGLWADFIVVCSVGKTESRAFGPSCWSIVLLLPSYRGCISSQWQLRTKGPAWITAKDPYFLSTPNSAFGPFCLFCAGEVSHQNLNFVELFLFWLRQGKNQFVVNSIFFLHVGVLAIGKVFTLIVASFMAASNAVIMSALGINNRQKFCYQSYFQRPWKVNH